MLIINGSSNILDVIRYFIISGSTLAESITSIFFTPIYNDQLLGDMSIATILFSPASLMLIVGLVAAKKLIPVL